MGRVECRFLGGAELWVDRVPATVDTRKAVALLAYLAVEGSARRDSLAGLLWPESDDARARSTLRRTLSAIRSSLGESAVVADRNTVTLADVSTDITSFQDAVAATTTHDHPPGDVCERCLPELEAAVRLYRGDFLAGFSLRDAPDFDDWSRTVAESLRSDVASVLERLAVGHAAAGDYRRAVSSAKRWTELDPLHEPAHRNLMLLRGWAGDRPGAVEAYRRCVQTLMDELGVPPLEETTELYEAVLDDDLPPPPGTRRRVEARMLPAALGGESLIDRRRELETLQRELAASATSGRVVFVTGDAWMGKTRILEEFAQSCRERSHRVLMARGYRAEEGLPYGIAVQLLRRAHSEGWIDPTALPDWAVAETARLLPELGEAPASDPLGEARLHDAVSTVLLSLTGGRSLVLEIDDGQWIDPASASMLSYLTRRLDDAGALIVVALRHGSGNAAAAAISEAFGGGSTRIELQPLEAGDLANLVPDISAAAEAIERTGGVPLLVAEYVEGGEALPQSQDVERYIEAKIVGLDGLASQVVAAVAVLDGTCEVDVIRAVSGRSEDEVVGAVEALAESRVLRVVPGTNGLGFTLEAMGRSIYERLAPVRRRLLHRRAAAALSASAAAASDARVAFAVATHLSRCGEAAEAGTWYLRAGELAAEVYAGREAEAAFRAALGMGGVAPGPIHFALGEVLLLGSRFDEATEAFEAAAAVGDDPMAALAEHRIGEVQRRLGRFERAEHHFALAEKGHPHPESLYSDWALLDHRIGRASDAEVRARKAVALAHERGDELRESRARDILGIVTEDVAELEQALRLAGDDRPARMAALNSLAYAVARRGDADRGLVLVDEAIELSQRIGDRHRQAALLNHRADLCHRLGREVESRAALMSAVRLFSDIQPDAWEPEVWLLTLW